MASPFPNRTQCAAPVVIVGGGVIGLMAAYELARRGVRSIVVEKGLLGRESSWAGAGIISPASLDHATDDDDRLRAHSFARFPSLSDEIQTEAGVDIGFRRNGGFELAFSQEEAEVLASSLDGWRRQGVNVEACSPGELSKREPALEASPTAGYWFPDIAQVRNPWLLRGLTLACERRGVELLTHSPVIGFEKVGDRLTGARLDDGSLVAGDQILIAGGAWSAGLLAPLGVELAVRPIKGQIIAFATPQGMIRHITQVGKRYFVPRDDGLVLVGSTEEEAGFTKETTEEGLVELRAFAEQLAPRLIKYPVTATWAGLRPATRRHCPYLGRIPALSNAWIATGHFRQGLQLSTGSAALLADWMTGRPSFADPSSFSLARTDPFRCPFHS